MRKALEKGQTSSFVLLITVSIFLMVGLVVDGGAKLSAASEASNIAQQASRYGAQSLSGLDQKAPRIDPAAAAARAQQYIRSTGKTGSARVTSPTTIQTRVTVTKPTTFLSLVGITRVSTTRTVSTSLIQGTTEETR
ncbi:Tad domain-containing protein [Dermabacteraceae bacterium CCM 9520]